MNWMKLWRHKPTRPTPSCQWHLAHSPTAAWRRKHMAPGCRPAVVGVEHGNKQSISTCKKVNKRNHQWKVWTKGPCLCICLRWQTPRLIFSILQLTISLWYEEQHTLGKPLSFLLLRITPNAPLFNFCCQPASFLCLSSWLVPERI